MELILIIVSLITLVFAVPKILEKEDKQHRENEKEDLADIIDVEMPDYDNIEQEENKILTAKEVFQLDDLEIFARTLYGEGRNLPREEIEKIAWVIRNRVQDNGRENFPDTYAEVCLQKYQFSCWNSLYHNQFKDSNQKEVRKNVLYNQNAYAVCKAIAQKVINASEIENPLENVQHYVLNTDEVEIEGNKIKKSPYADWTKNLEVVENDGKGSHIFLGQGVIKIKVNIVNDEININFDNEESKHLVRQLKQVGVKFSEFKNLIDKKDFTKLDVNSNTIAKNYIINAVNKYKREGVL